MEALEAIRKRYSCRSFARKQISDDQTQALIAAAKAAPAAMGDHSGIALTVIQNEETRMLIDEQTARSMPMMGDHPTYEAPTLFLISIKKNDNFPMIPYCNASCMAENIMVAATSLELASVYIMAVPTAMQQKPELCDALGIENHFLPAVMVACGYESGPACARKERALAVRTI